MGTMHPERRARAFGKLTILASRPCTGGVCSPVSESEDTPWWVAVPYKSQAAPGCKASHVLEKLRPHTGWARARARGCLSGSSQAFGVDLAVPLQATRCVGSTAGLPGRAQHNPYLSHFIPVAPRDQWGQPRSVQPSAKDGPTPQQPALFTP